MFFQVIVHHAHYDYCAERIFVQTYPTFRVIDYQSCFRYLANFAKRSKNPRCYKWCGSVSHWTRELRCHESNRYSARSAVCHPGFYQTDIAHNLSTFLVNSTGRFRKLFLLVRVHSPVHRVYTSVLANLVNSRIWGCWNGHEAARQYFLELSLPQPNRRNFITRALAWLHYRCISDGRL